MFAAQCVTNDLIDFPLSTQSHDNQHPSSVRPRKIEKREAEPDPIRLVLDTCEQATTSHSSAEVPVFFGTLTLIILG